MFLLLFMCHVLLVHFIVLARFYVVIISSSLLFVLVDEILKAQDALAEDLIQRLLAEQSDVGHPLGVA